MRKLSMLFAVLAVVAMIAGPAFASTTTHKTHDVKLTVVSMDEKAKTMTVKMENGEEKTVPVMGAAVNKMKNLKAGEMITAVCTDNDKGEHQGISDFKPEHHASKK